MLSFLFKRVKNKNKISFLLFGLCILAWLFIFPKKCLAEEHLIINEVAIGIGSASNEFIEIYNPTSSDINLKTQGIQLILVNSANNTTKKTLAWHKESILAGEFFIFGSGDIKKSIDVNFSAQLTGTSGVILSDKNGDAIDKVGWGETSLSNAIEGIFFSLPNGLKTNNSIGRKNFIDTDNNANDFYIFTTPTPGEDNKKEPLPTPEPTPLPPKIYTSKLRLNEILPNPEGNDKKDYAEWIEIYNSIDKEIDLTKCEINGRSLSGKIDHLSFKIIYPSLTLTNTKFTLELLCEDLNIKDSVSYENAPDNESYNFYESGWEWSKNLTPGKENIKTSTLPESPKVYSSKIRLNEILPKPLKGEEEFIELYNAGEKSDLTGWKLEDRSKSKCELTGEIKAQDFFIVPDCKIKLNDTQGETLSLFNPNAQAVSFLSYESSAKENKSYAFNGTTWRWSQFLTPGVENKFNNPPTSKTKKDKNFYVGVYAQFEAKGTDADKDKLKYTWDFGDGHKSYLAKTRHKFEKTGKYTVTLKISDGSEDKQEIYNIEVKKYPKRKVEIIEISANPQDKDTKNEYIILKNKEKKEINLNGWSIATGTKKLINHPITEDLVIAKNKTLKITHTFSKFSLNNKKGKLELRYPNGKVASKLSYDKGTEGVAEGEIYTKINKIWQWQKTIATNIEKQTVVKNTDSTVVTIEALEPQVTLALSTETVPINSKLINYASKINPPEKFISFKNYPLLELENKYFFLSPFPEKKHYLLYFWEKLRAQLNLFLLK